jgi:uncharacterized membrane protein
MLADIGVFHPQVVHFVVALLFVGVSFRIVSLTGKLRFTGPAATTLIVLGSAAAFAAVLTGDQAHGPVERIPGAHDAVEEHEEWGERTRNIFIVVALLEVGTLVTAATGRRGLGKGVAIASAVIGLGGLFILYEAAEHGGAIVYEYAGGPGLRSGESEHIEQAFVAGLYNQAVVAVRAGRSEEASRLIGELIRMRPDDRSVKRLRAAADSAAIP